ncbi:MAG TPA: phytanoyl-CoA dioxygenase family protein [Alphaproteobacteria bacterium]|nr:phytanoyl-CoA dioxygenase family protein [Alphaproteobacteria bacterium]
MPNDPGRYNLHWDPDRLPKPTRDGARLKDDIEVFGYCIVERALEGETLETIRRRLFEQADAERQMHNKKNPANIDPLNQWVGMLLNKGEVFFKLIQHPLCMSLIEHLIGPDYLISCVDAQIQHPGAGEMPLHTDQWWMPGPHEPGLRPARPADAKRNTGGAIEPLPSGKPIAPIAAVNVMWMITDFSIENGATRLVPCSHLSGKQPDPSVPHKIASVAALGPAGTAFAFDARLWHGAAPNRSRESRFGITTVGCGPQFRQLENYPRGLRPEVMRRCPPAILSRLGFSAWSSYGHTGDPDARVVADGTESLGELRG